MSKGKEGYSPENIHKVQEIGKADFEGFVRKAQESNVPMEFHEKFEVAAFIYYLRRLSEGAISMFMYPSIDDKGYVGLAATTLGLDNVPAAKAKYAVTYADAIAQAKSLNVMDDYSNRLRGSINEGEEYELVDDAMRHSSHEDKARSAYNLALQQEEKAIDATLLNSIRHYDLTPEEILETRNYVENYLANPQKQGK